MLGSTRTVKHLKAIDVGKVDRLLQSNGQRGGLFAFVLSFIATVFKLACSCITVLVIGLGGTIAILRYRDAKAKNRENDRSDGSPGS